MKKIFQEYGGVITTVISVVTLIGIVMLLMAPGGVIDNAFGSITNSFVDKAQNLVDNAGNGGPGGGELPETGVDAATREITDSWEQIQTAVSTGVYSTRYQVGDTKTFTHETYGEVVMQIVAFNQDTKTNGDKAAISWVSKDIITQHAMNSSGSNANGWVDSEMRTWLQGEFYNALPSDVKAVIVEVNKTYYDYTDKTTETCADKVWIPSAGEVFGGTSLEAHGANYAGYFNNSTARMKCDFNNDSAKWWLRSAYSLDSHYFSGVSLGGEFIAGPTTVASNTYGVVLGFCM